MRKNAEETTTDIIYNKDKNTNVQCTRFPNF